ncbi:ABC transporter ATP-binding protein [Massilia sp. W12]|uniref:ABC transporter ATP-binding protein n=1 Tax=Massilia sp. W12 TaxID=3126507 RepID=UPI0030CB68E6
MSQENVVEVRDLQKQYSMSSERLVILNNASFTARAGELVLIMGPSGSGKTTFVSLLAGMDSTYKGSIRIDGLELEKLSEQERVRLRSTLIGLVFQDHRLLPQLTALENVEAPMYLRNFSASERRSRAADALQLVSLSERMQHRPGQLSGGEKQRTAIARALVCGAKVLLCDEPTGSLNREMSMQIFRLLKELCKRLGKTVVMTTHDPAAIEFADQLLILEDGKLVKSVDKNEVTHAATSS